MLIGLALGVFNQFFHIFTVPVTQGISSSLFGLLAGGGTLYFVSEVYLKLRNKVGLGMGDVKLLAMTGLIFGPRCALSTIFLGSLAGSVIGIGQIIFIKGGASKPLPFGPYLAFGTLLFLFGEELIPGGIPIFQF